MVKDFKYIIKRIIIGTGIALALMYLKGTLIADVYANQISPYNALGYSEDIGSNSASVIWDVPGDPWKSHGNGILRFSFAINKTSGASTDPVITPRLVRAYNGNTIYVCNFGSTYATNSTWTGQSYSVECPMNMDANGLTEILVAFLPFSQLNTSYYKISFPPDMSFEVYEGTSVNVQVDTSSINNSINNQITNDNSNTQSIINNQNDNTQQQIESQKVCKDIDKSSIVIDNKYINSPDGITLASDSSFGITDYIPITSSTINVLTVRIGGARLCFYNVNKETISCVQNNQLVLGNLSIPQGGYYFRASINKAQNRPSFQVCTNGNQAIADGQQQLNDTLTDDSGVSDNDIEDLFGDFEESDSPISDLLTMPITLAQAYLDGFGGTCSSINLGSLYGTNLIIPCIDLQSKLGSTLWNLIDVLFSLFMLYNIAMLIVKVFDGITSLNDQFDEAMGRGGISG